MPNPGSAPRPRVGEATRLLFSLSGVFPLGAFLIAHIAVNALALRSDTAFASAIRVVHRIPALALFEWLFVFAPLLLHGAVGLWLVVTRTPLAEASPYPGSLRIAVRATGVAALAFIALHLNEFRFRMLDVRLGGGELATVLDADLSSTWHGVPWRGAAYLAGTACVTFHFAAGLWAFSVRTRSGNNARARKWAGWGAGATGAVLWMLLANAVVFRATGGRLFGAHEERAKEGADVPCPVEAPPGP